MSNSRDRGGRGPSQPPLPKPYAFVPLARRVVRSAPTGHQKFQHLSGTVTGTLIARSPVHVASGLLEQTMDRRYPMVKAHARSEGTPMIPATSLKGCIRSIAEAISPSSITVTRSRDVPSPVQASRSMDNLDVVQRVFGALGYQGHVRFADAKQIAGAVEIVPTPQLFRPRPEAIGTYVENRFVRGRKFYMHGALAGGDLPLEACAIDSRFSLRFDFESLTAGELGLVLYALGLGEPRLWPKLGGAKPACLGTLECVDVRVETVDVQAAYTGFDVAPRVQPTEPLFQAALDEGIIVQEHLGQLAEILRWPREDRDCPDRNY